MFPFDLDIFSSPEESSHDYKFFGNWILAASKKAGQ